MERQGIPHNVNLLATFDTPHRGANIPLGDQEFFEFFDNDSDGAARGKRAVRSTAARQMLVYHYEALFTVPPRASTHYGPRSKMS